MLFHLCFLSPCYLGENGFQFLKIRAQAIDLQPRFIYIASTKRNVFQTSVLISCLLLKRSPMVKFKTLDSMY